MPRQARLDAPGMLQHVIVRGINRADIFLDDVDRRQFVARLGRLLVETETDCFAWALMPNHFHLLLRCRQVRLALFMRRLLTGYAVTFNRRHDRVGHLFQNRYKSIVCEEDAYLLELIRYIHLNPLRAGLVNELAQLDLFPWCGHSVLLGHGEMVGQSVGPVLALFADRLPKARRQYRQFLSDGVAMGRRPELAGARGQYHRELASQFSVDEEFDPRVLGGSTFVENLQNKTAPCFERSCIMDLDVLLERVASFFELPAGDLSRRGRRNRHAEARELFCFLAVRCIRYSGPKVGAVLDMGVPSVSRAVRRGEKLAASRPEMLRWWERQLKQ